MSNSISNDMKKSRIEPATANELISTEKNFSTASPPTKNTSSSANAPSVAFKLFTVLPLARRSRMMGVAPSTSMMANKMRKALATCFMSKAAKKSIMARMIVSPFISTGADDDSS